MPQRTNDFQELVSLIRRALSKEGDTVEDSAMVRVQGLETEREIDILHTTPDGFSTIKISVEAKDEGRKIDVTTLEQLCAKYRGEGRVCVDKFIVVSRNGFTEGALEKAKLLDVPLLTLDEAKDFDWSALGPEQKVLQGRAPFQFRMAPHFHEIKIVPPLPAGLEKAIINEGKVLCSKCPPGRDHGTLLEYATNVTLKRTDDEARSWFKQLEDRCRENPDGATLSLGLRLADGFQVRHAGADYPMRELHVAIHAVDAVGVAKCTPYQLASSEGGKRIIHHLDAEVGSARFQFAMPDGLKSERISVRVGATPKERARLRQKQKKADKTRRKKRGAS
jgi:hypothetical protein